MEDLCSKDVYKLRRSLIPLFIELISSIAPVGLIFWLIDIGNCVCGHILFQDPSMLYRIFGVCALIATLEMIRRYFNDLYVFGHQRIIHFSGCLSFNLRKTSIYYSDVKEILLQQSLFARIAHYGTLKFGTASTDDLEIIFQDIPLPTRLARYVQEFINTSRTGDDPEKIKTLFYALAHPGCLASGQSTRQKVPV